VSPDVRFCPNCETPLNDRYCSKCGQDNRHARLSARRLFASTFAHVFDLEQPLFKTIIGLSWRPGRVPRGYVEGRRKRYTNPIKYAFITAAVMVLVLSGFGISPSAALRSTMPAPPPLAAAPVLAPGQIPTETERKALLKAEITRLSREAPHVVENNLNILTLPAIPLVALPLLLLFARSERHYAEHCVFLFYTFGQTFLINTLWGLIGGYGSIGGMLAIEIITVAYLAWSAVGFYGTRVLTTVPRALAIELTSMVVTSVLGVIMVTAWIAWNITMFIGGLPR
jgi:hypothetical protein